VGSTGQNIIHSKNSTGSTSQIQPASF
jgi:hypothetical protein